MLNNRGSKLECLFGCHVWGDSINEVDGCKLIFQICAVCNYVKITPTYKYPPEVIRMLSHHIKDTFGVITVDDAKPPWKRPSAYYYRVKNE